MEFKIVPATPSDAGFIADAVMTAIGRDICLKMAGDVDRLDLLREVFTRLGAMEDSQYSYLNSSIAFDPMGNRAGAVICYDGALLHRLRLAFIRVSNDLLGWNLSEIDFTDETSADEVYLDSLMVRPEYRRRGLGGLLIAEASRKAKEAGKPLGLLVDYDNPDARRLYIAQGFRSVGSRKFAGVDMEHLQILQE